MTWNEFCARYPRLFHVTVEPALVDELLHLGIGLPSANRLIEFVGGHHKRIAWRWLSPSPETDDAEPWSEMEVSRLQTMLRYRSCPPPSYLEHHHRATRLAIGSLDDTPRRPRAILGNHYPLGGNAESIQRVLKDGLDVGEWIRTLNEHFYVFPNEATANGFKQRQLSAFGETNVRAIAFETQRLPRSAQDKMRLSKINGGSINGMALRGKGTYLPLDAWTHQKEPKEIGFISGLSSDEIRACTTSDWVLTAVA